MLKQNMIVLSLLFMAVLSGCSNGISQSDYDQVISEEESIQKEYDALQESYDKLKTVNADLLKEKAANMAADLPSQYAQAWVDSCFSGNGFCAVSEDTLFVSLLTGKEVNEENVKEMRNELLSSIKVYAYVSKTTPDSFPWKHLSVTFYDSSGAGIFQLTMDTDESATVRSILVNAMYVADLAEWIQ